jgi:small-conductance mechanosensitive channel/CRP-like cAMP-binding protein
MVILLFGLAAPVTYLALLALGRWLRRRRNVRLDFTFHFFAISVALLLPLRTLEVGPKYVQLTEAVVMLSGTPFLLALIRRFFWEGYFEQKQQAPVPRFVKEVVALGVVGIALLMVVTIIYGQTIPGLLAGSGIAAVILGLAMQDTLGNVIAGIAIHFEKPFKPGDWLVIENRDAEVMEVNWRATRLRTNDNIYLDIPNSQMAKQTLINLTFPTRLHAMRLTLRLDFRVPPNDVKEALHRAARKAEHVAKEPLPKVFLTAFDESALLYEIKFWMEDHSRYNDAADAIRTNIWYELDRRQIPLPYPTRTLTFGTAADAKPPMPAARELLRQQALFQNLDDPNLNTLANGAHRYRFGRGEKLIEQDAEGHSMFVLIRGEASVYVRNNGQMTQVGDLRAGDCFGEMSLLTGEKRRATVLATTDCDVLEIEKASLATVFQQKPEVMQHLSELLAKRQMENEQILNRESPSGTPHQRKQYESTFLSRLRAFFEL